MFANFVFLETASLPLLVPNTKTMMPKINHKSFSGETTQNKSNKINVHCIVTVLLMQIAVAHSRSVVTVQIDAVGTCLNVSKKQHLLYTFACKIPLSIPCSEGGNGKFHLNSDWMKLCHACPFAVGG